MVPGEVVLGRYRLERLLGSGGVGRVYRACDLLSRQLGDPDPFVAIKVLGDEQAQASDASVLLHREYALTAHLHHRNVVRAMRFDVEPDKGYPLFTLELMRGLDLAQLKRERPEGLPWRELREIAVQLFDALAYIHERGILHGDIKPGNVMLTEQGLRLFDFGLAQPLAGVLTGLPELRRQHFDAWTPAYAAPELMEGGRLTPLTDVFAAACVVYELACGSHPFMRLDALRARAERLDRSLRMPASLPAACRSMLHRALVLDPHERQAQASDLHQAFLRATGGWGSGWR